MAMNREYLMHELKEFILYHQSETIVYESAMLRSTTYQAEKEDLLNFIETERKPSLQQILFTFIDQTGKTDAEIYTRASIDRKLFSKIRTKPDYHPSKRTILALGLALELNKADLNVLLEAAGYSLSKSETTDLVIQFFLEKNIYDIDLVNQGLDSLNLKPLTGIL